MKKFRCKLPYAGTPWIRVEARNVDEAMDKAAKHYGWANYEQMKRAHSQTWTDDNSGFRVELDREDRRDGPMGTG